MSSTGPTLREKRERIDRFGVLALYEVVLGHEVRVGRTFTSPLRDDRSPSFNIYRGSNGKFLWKDFADDRGDIYSLIMKMENIGFKEAIDRLYALIGAPDSGQRAMRRMIKAPVFVRPAKRAVITTEYRSFSEWDECFWKTWNIGKLLLLRYRVHPLEEAKIVPVDKDKRTMQLHYEEGNPLYGIFIDSQVKLYRPLNPDRKFKMMGNTGADSIFGLEQLESDRKQLNDVVIAGGNKDVLAWMGNAMGDSLGALAMNSETATIQEHHMLRISRVAKRVWVCYDNDETGKKQQAIIKARYPFVRTIELKKFSEEKDFAKVVEKGKKDELQAIRNSIQY